MPTKITPSSNYLQGEISIEDINRITRQYKDHVILSTNNDRAITKLDEISIPIEMIEGMIRTIPVAMRVNCKLIIRFGVTLEEQLDCQEPHVPVGNHLSVVLLLENNGTSKESLDDSIITPGFKDYRSPGLGLSLSACCPVIGKSQG